MLEFYKDKKILITGDTGFKGSWLSLILYVSGAKVIGISDSSPRSNDIFYNMLNLEDRIKHYDIDIRDYNSLKNVFDLHNPDIVFHLAAQPLVRESYNDPLNTFDINVMGSINIMECIRHSQSVKSFVLVTTDKVYKDNSWLWGYRETDDIGGIDPYAASKSMVEQAFISYQKSFFNKTNIGTSTARGGNVIGGGDFSIDRIIPDCYKSITSGYPVILRQPDAVRPWQHVFDLLYGYLLLGKKIYEEPHLSGTSWNFGPDNMDQISVINIVKMFLDIWQTGEFKIEKNNDDKKETICLLLDSSKSHKLLNWEPSITISTAIKLTADWYKEVMIHKKNAFDYSINQINEFFKSL